MIGIISYTESNTGQKKEVRVNKSFWNENSYYPSEGEIRIFLHNEGYRHVINAKFSYVMIR